MRKLILMAALATSAMASSAYAASGPYVMIEGGAVKQERSDKNGPTGFEGSNRFKAGWEAGGALGYDFGNFRLEAEGFYTESKMASSVRETRAYGPVGYYTRDGGTLAGHTSTLAVMGNALFSVGHWGGAKMYAGGGVGYADVYLSEGLPGVNAPISPITRVVLPGRHWPV
jgi:opacity protein-like surface antigen